eukprot:TRINITY_DN12677_c0_g1_i1.p1 TRINITY_DN12677_c0_g1~~TRINITY_DN12677_c0_g1_i1.p1  ORF type:complete len:208 (+),score=41.97 TRINITY_DN12677_c0_g1_i1:129-752(+)
MWRRVLGRVELVDKRFEKQLGVGQLSYYHRLGLSSQTCFFSSTSQGQSNEDGHRYTLAILKPDVVSTLVDPVETKEEADIVPSIIQKIQEEGFNIAQGSVNDKVQLSIEQAEKFYGEHRGRFFYSRLVSFITSGPIIPLVLEKKDGSAIQAWRKLIGPTHLRVAKKQDPSSLRAKFGLSDTRNVAHGSDSPSSARKEIEFFFPNFAW